MGSTGDNCLVLFYHHFYDLTTCVLQVINIQDHLHDRIQELEGELALLRSLRDGDEPIPQHLLHDSY